MPTSASAVTAAELRRFTLFAGLDDGIAERLCTQVRALHLNRGEVVVEYRSTTTNVFLLLEGQLLANRFSASGQEVGYRRLHLHSYFGELAAFDSAPRSVNIVTLTEARVGSITAPAFNAMIADVPGVARALLTDMAQTIRELSNRLFEASAVSVPGRVEAELTRMALAQGLSEDGDFIDNMPTHAELATLIGGQRETVTRALGRLVDLGIVAKQGRGLVIRDFEALLDRTEESGD